MRTNEEIQIDDSQTGVVCFPDGKKIQTWIASVESHDMVPNDGGSTEKWWWVNFGGLHREGFYIDKDEWPEFVTWINEMNELVKEKFGA